MPSIVAPRVNLISGPNQQADAIVAPTATGATFIMYADAASTIDIYYVPADGSAPVLLAPQSAVDDAVIRITLDYNPGHVRVVVQSSAAARCFVDLMTYGQSAQ